MDNFFWLRTEIHNRSVKVTRNGECMGVEAPEGTRRERDKRMASFADSPSWRSQHIYTWFFSNTLSRKPKDSLKQRTDQRHFKIIAGRWRTDLKPSVIQTQIEKAVSHQCCLTALRGRTGWRHTRPQSPSDHHVHPETSPWLPTILTKCFFLSSSFSSPLHTKGGQSSSVETTWPTVFSCLKHIKKVF